MSDLTSYWGKAKNFIVSVRDQGVAIDITGKDLRFSAKVKRTDPDPPLILKAVGTGITIDPDQVANRGRATIAITSADTNNSRFIHPDRATTIEWDLELVQGDPIIIDSGQWEILPTVRRA